MLENKHKQSQSGLSFIYTVNHVYGLWKLQYYAYITMEFILIFLLIVSCISGSEDEKCIEEFKDLQECQCYNTGQGNVFYIFFIIYYLWY